jgi:hypothetical protein
VVVPTLVVVPTSGLSAAPFSVADASLEIVS